MSSPGLILLLTLKKQLCFHFYETVYNINFLATLFE